jgi:ubiquinone/menaquinone biosynthesis C-methylase UbiE
MTIDQGELDGSRSRGDPGGHPGNSLSPFTTRVQNYVSYRPHYPPAIIGLLQEDCHLTKNALIADIGSGTGMLTELFLNNGNRVFGIEPDPDMRVAAEQLLRIYPGFTSLAGTAEAIPLPDHQVDFVTAGQAFHWFDSERARREFIRILMPSGWVMLVWNRQKTTGTPFLDALERFWQTYLTGEGLNAQATGQDLTKLLQQQNPVYRLRLHPERMDQEVIAPFFHSNAFKMKRFENPYRCDLAALKGRVLSAGTAPQADHPRYTQMLEDLETIFQAHQKNGSVTIEYETELYYGQLTPEE